MELVYGPVQGYFLACYTVHAQDGFYAYAKVCEEKPASPWDARGIAKVAAGPHITRRGAMLAVVNIAEARLAARNEALWTPTTPDYT